MPPLSHYIEACLGTIFTFSKKHDSQLVSKVLPDIAELEPSVEISSKELGAVSPGSFTAGKHELLGQNLFPDLSWTVPSSPGASDAAATIVIKSWLLLVEDPDSPLPSPGIHGIFYDIPKEKYHLTADDFDPDGDAKRSLLKGGFKYGQNRRGTIWIGPRPVISHGNHRYFFTVVGLNTEQLLDKSSELQVSREALNRPDGLLKGKVVCWGQYVANFERKLR